METQDHFVSGLLNKQIALSGCTLHDVMWALENKAGEAEG